MEFDKARWRRLPEWLIPILLSAAIHYLQSISSEMTSISRNLAVAVQRVDDHEHRITELEVKVFHNKRQ